MRSVAASVTTTLSAEPAHRAGPAWLAMVAGPITASPIRTRLTVVAALILIAALAAALTPGARSAIASFFGLTHIEVERTDATPPPASDERTRQPAIAGLTTLAEAQGFAGFPVSVPTYPADLGPPDEVYFQDLDPGRQVVLVYDDDADRTGLEDQTPLIALFQFKTEGFFRKTIFPATLIEETTVGNTKALWFEGVAHQLQYLGPDGAVRTEFERTVEGNTLVWEVDGITYRLETSLAMGDAVKTAESIRRLP